MTFVCRFLLSQQCVYCKCFLLRLQVLIWCLRVVSIYLLPVPLCDSIGAYGGGARYALAEVRVNGRARDGLQPLELPRRGHVEPLDHVVHHPDRQDHRQEDWRRETYHE